jgi:hypothetical protein
MVCVLALGCESGAERAEPAPESLPAAAREASPSAAPPPAAPGGSVVTDSYVLEARTAERHPAGELGQVTIEITGKGEWHVNQDFPTRVEVSAGPALELPKTSLTKGDASEFAEERARFEVPFTAEAPGEHQVVADVAFAICTEETCIPQRKTVAALVRVD